MTWTLISAALFASAVVSAIKAFQQIRNLLTMWTVLGTPAAQGELQDRETKTVVETNIQLVVWSAMAHTAYAVLCVVIARDGFASFSPRNSTGVLVWIAALVGVPFSLGAMWNLGGEISRQRKIAAHFVESKLRLDDSYWNTHRKAITSSVLWIGFYCAMLALCLPIVVSATRTWWRG
jgi:hypothetical protein